MIRRLVYILFFIATLSISFCIYRWITDANPDVLGYVCELLSLLCGVSLGILAVNKDKKQ